MHPQRAGNRDAIADVLATVLLVNGTVLQVASGSGDHCLYFAQRYQDVAVDCMIAKPVEDSTIRRVRAGSIEPSRLNGLMQARACPAKAAEVRFSTSRWSKQRTPARLHAPNAVCQAVFSRAAWSNFLSIVSDLFDESQRLLVLNAVLASEISDLVFLAAATNEDLRYLALLCRQPFSSQAACCSHQDGSATPPTGPRGRSLLLVTLTKAVPMLRKPFD
ncbi:DUF938 domain-containing protein [Novosphingobium sp. 9U]|uniref:DUF938 domain-containing protein n=1 Tax=Novosphingobium sp. 9U TaxID=2653158 RepID=UPI0012F29412|nr:hypothetical protein NOVOSPHI9U_210027 [Novosphingobium sp. 9U]